MSTVNGNYFTVNFFKFKFSVKIFLIKKFQLILLFILSFSPLLQAWQQTEERTETRRSPQQKLCERKTRGE